MASKGKILIIDDEADMVESCAGILSEFGYECLTETKSDQALARLSEVRPDLILTDLRMPGKDGIDILKAAKGSDPEMIVILFTAYGTIPSAVEAIKGGAFDYIQKPFSMEQLKISVERGLRQKQLREENQCLRQQLEERYGFDRIIGKSRAMLLVFETIRKVAPTDANILISGETGTGKELIARSIHANSRRAAQSFVPVDCAALPENLLESELFGHERGAFTGAYTTRPGIFEFADGGTLLLDEVSQLSYQLQAKLLRAVQERHFRRVGGQRLIHVDIRILSAVNIDLQAAMKAGQFREDLYYRLNIVSIHLPPLRERQGDVPLIARHFLNEFNRANDQLRSESVPPVKSISKEAMELLENHSWPGNVRELQNAIERAVSLANGEVILPGDLPPEIHRHPALKPPCPSADLTFKEAKKDKIETFEEEYLTQLLKKHKGNISLAAKQAGIDRRTIYRLLEKYGRVALIDSPH